MRLLGFTVKDGKVFLASGICERCGNVDVTESRVPWTEEEARRTIEASACPICGRGPENSELSPHPSAEPTPSPQGEGFIEREGWMW